MEAQVEVQLHAHTVLGWLWNGGSTHMDLTPSGDFCLFGVSLGVRNTDFGESKIAD